MKVRKKHATFSIDIELIEMLKQLRNDNKIVSQSIFVNEAIKKLLREEFKND